MKNILSEDPSPYLQQHKNNPVHWQTWNKATLNLAKIQKKPILLSVGYSSCHWCHVMAHESFEDQSTADLMNKFFINIKVDREERPDLDFVFQSSFQLFNQSGGGWPLTMFLDENGVPFMGGTYFPKDDKHGLPAFKTILKKVHDAYVDQRTKIIEQKNLITKNLKLKKTKVIGQEPEPILENILNNLDDKNGGYKGAPKFPTFYVYETLIYFYNKTKNPKYLKPVELILNKLCSKGIYDHVEGGISRYTVDENWLIPHFEKMLYDNIQFILLLAKFLKIKDYLQGAEQLTMKAKCLIIASSLKDIGAFQSMRLPNIELVAPDSENVTITASILDKYKSNYEYVFTMFDNDEAGIKAMNMYWTEHQIPYIHFDYEKDFAESIKQHGIENTKIFFKLKFKDAIRKNKRSTKKRGHN